MSTFRTKKESFAKSPEATLEDEEFNFVTKNLNKPKHKDYKTDCKLNIMYFVIFKN